MGILCYNALNPKQQEEQYNIISIINAKGLLVNILYLSYFYLIGNNMSNSIIFILFYLELFSISITRFDFTQFLYFINVKVRCYNKNSIKKEQEIIRDNGSKDVLRSNQIVNFGTSLSA